MTPGWEPGSAQGGAELEWLARLPGVRFAEQMAIVAAHMGLVLGAVQAELDSGWIGPEYSPLGREQHEAAVERRMQRRMQRRMPPSSIGANIVAGRHLLTISALADEYFLPVHVAIARASAANDNARGLQ
jgi:hypothetical protein